MRNKIKEYARLTWLLRVATESKPTELIDQIARQESISDLNSQISDNLFEEEGKELLPHELMCS